MSAIPEQFLSDTAKVDAASIRPYPNSRKIYVQGSRADIRVPMREICLTDTQTGSGTEQNPALTIYDTSGPYTDPEVAIDIRKGLPDVRSAWIEERGDTERLTELSSEYGRARARDPQLDVLRFPHYNHTPRRARPGCSVTQMHYARRGIITP